MSDSIGKETDKFATGDGEVIQALTRIAISTGGMGRTNGELGPPLRKSVPI